MMFEIVVVVVIWHNVVVVVVVLAVVESAAVTVVRSTENRVQSSGTAVGCDTAFLGRPQLNLAQLN